MAKAVALKKYIGLFDSGVGGLTVLKQLKKNFPFENFIYLGDTARLPYGNKSPETIKRYLKQNCQFLTKFPLKALVIACNSASSILYDSQQDESLEDKLGIVGLPIIEVISSSAQAALQQSKSKKIAVWGTTTTISSHAYKICLERANQEVTVIELACPLLVPLVECGWQNEEVTQLTLKKYWDMTCHMGKPDCLILGCTHYPILREQIRAVVGSEISIIDSGSAIISLLENGIELKRSGDAELNLYFTDSTDALVPLIHEVLHPFNYTALQIIDL